MAAADAVLAVAEAAANHAIKKTSEQSPVEIAHFFALNSRVSTYAKHFLLKHLIIFPSESIQFVRRQDDHVRMNDANELFEAGFLDFALF